MATCSDTYLRTLPSAIATGWGIYQSTSLPVYRHHHLKYAPVKRGKPPRQGVAKTDIAKA